MKNTILLIALLTLFFASCKKDEEIGCLDYKYSFIFNTDSISGSANDYTGNVLLELIRTNNFVELVPEVNFPPVAPEGADYCNFLDTLGGNWIVTKEKP